MFKGLSRLAEIVAGLMLAAIFIAFLIQIGSRYLPRLIDALGLTEVLPGLAAVEPTGWTLELIGILWVWVIFFACAFVVREHEHVKFDILYLAVPQGARRVMAMLSAVAIVAGMLYALLPTWDYIDFMKLRRTSTVENPFTGDKIRLRTIFSIYAVFLVAVSARYAWQFWTTLRHGAPKTELEMALDENDAPEDRT